MTGQDAITSGTSAAPRRHPRFGAIILAAGASTRLGRPKQLLMFEGTPLLVRAVEAALASDAWPVIVVLGAHAEAIRPSLARLPILIAENATWAEGMASSIRAGITLLQQFSRGLDAALIALCDQPAFSANTISRLVESYCTTNVGIVATRHGNRPGAPAIFDRQHFAALAALTGEEGARTLLNGDISRVGTIEAPELAFDIDTPSDLEKLSPPQ